MRASCGFGCRLRALPLRRYLSSSRRSLWVYQGAHRQVVVSSDAQFVGRVFESLQLQEAGGTVNEHFGSVLLEMAKEVES